MSTIVRRSNYAEYGELPVPVQRKLDEDCVLVQHEDDGRCKSEPDSTSARVIDIISNSTSIPDPVGGDRPVRAYPVKQCHLLSSRH